MNARTANGPAIAGAALMGLALSSGLAAVLAPVALAQEDPSLVQTPNPSRDAPIEPTPSPQPTVSGDATTDPARVRSLISAVEPLWSDLSAQQREVLAPFESQWNAWPSDEKKVWVVLATRFPTLPPQAKGKALLRVREWAELSPAERLVARQNYQLARERDQGQRGKEWRRYQELTPEQRSVLRDNGTVSNTAAGQTPPSGLAREAAQPLSIKPVSGRADGR